MIGGVVEQFEKILPRSQAEISVVQQRLVRAGFRSDTAVKTFYGAKVMTPIVSDIAVVGDWGDSSQPVLYSALCGRTWISGSGFLAGEKDRKPAKTRSEKDLPDVLDLLVICVEAGLSLDQATARTAQELEKSQPALSDELGIVALEQRAGRARSDAWKHLAERTDVDVIRNLVSMLVQAEQFGTSIGKTLRVHSDTLRTKRVQEIEEKAAKLSVKLLFPLVLFIFPSLFLVVLGPAVLVMADSFKTFFGH